MSSSAPAEPEKVRHILSLSGGKDSAALAIYMRDRVPDMEYIFHDTGKELPDTIEFLERIEGYLGKKIVKTTFGTTFDDLLRSKGGMLPSNHRRWCTEYMKLKPFEDYIGTKPCINYVGIRADEKRIGYVSHKPNIKAVFPFIEDGIDYAGVIRILENSGLGLPPFMGWGRSRSGCFFCFYQQKIEWVRMRRKYPDLYEQAKAYEKPNRTNGNIFYWCEDESLADLEKPERIAEIEDRWNKQQERLKSQKKNVPLISTLGGAEHNSSEERACMICQL
jgi:3'-phosphoadenosine 5'-phosphosulfate sulfotransferase (PAPS reductase)/FAD synthetase